MYYIPIFLRSARRDRESVTVARFVVRTASAFSLVQAELLDLKALNMPMMEARLRFRNVLPAPSTNSPSGSLALMQSSLSLPNTTVDIQEC